LIKRINVQIILSAFLISLMIIQTLTPFCNVLLSNSTSSINSLYINKVAKVRVDIGYAVFAEGGYVFVTDNDGLVIIDARTPAKAKKISTIRLGESAFGVAVRNDLAYIVGPGLTIADISDPSNPIILGSSSDSAFEAVCINNSYAYVTGLDGALRIYNIANPSNPYLVKHLADDGWGMDLAFHEEILYLADPNNGLQVINVSNPSSPQILQTVSNTYGAWDISIYNNTLYLGCHGHGVRILDISTPETPQIIRNYYDIGEAYGVSGDNNYLFVGDLQEGIIVLNVSSPSHPTEITRYSAAASHDIFYDGSYVYDADQDHGLLIFVNEAMKYRNFQKAKPNLASKMQKPGKVLSSGVKKSKTDENFAKRREKLGRLKKTGSIHDAHNVFLDMIKNKKPFIRRDLEPSPARE